MARRDPKIEADLARVRAAQQGGTAPAPTIPPEFAGMSDKALRRIAATRGPEAQAARALLDQRGVPIQSNTSRNILLGGATLAGLYGTSQVAGAIDRAGQSQNQMMAGRGFNYGM